MILLLVLIVGALLFISKPSERTAADILRAVREIDPEHNPKLQRGAPPAPDSKLTWCNKFVAWVTSALGAPVPFAEYGTPANAQTVWLQSSPAWRESSEVQARAAAVAGRVTLATYFNPDGTGHIALVLPYLTETRIAQAGAKNFNDGPLSAGFGSLPVVFFVSED